MSQQGLRQASVRAITGTTHNYEGDWHALFDAVNIDPGPFNQRLLTWINARLSTSYTNINGAMAAFAAAEGASTFGAIGTFTTSDVPVLAMDDLWTETDNLPDFAISGYIFVESESVTLEIHTSSDFTTPDYSYPKTVSAGEAASQLLSFPITALADDDWFARIVVGAGPSNTVTFTVNAVAAVTYTAHPELNDGVDGASFAFTITSMEAVSAGRVMQADFAATKSSGTAVVSSAVFTPTVGTPVNLVLGVASSGAATRSMESWYGVVPEDTGGTLTVTWNNTQLRCGANVWTMTGVQTTPSDTSTVALATTTTAVVTLDAPTGGLLIGSARHSTSASDNTISWVASSGSLVETHDFGVETSMNLGGAVVTGATGLGVTMTATFASSASHAVGLAWSPL